jgi:hypothetical protein
MSFLAPSVGWKRQPNGLTQRLHGLRKDTLYQGTTKEAAEKGT